MAGNRRGFIGIFSPQTDNIDSEIEEDLASESSEVPTGQETQAKTPSPSNSKTESDWDDVFGDSPRQRPTSSSGSIGAMLASDPALKNGGREAEKDSIEPSVPKEERPSRDSAPAPEGNPANESRDKVTADDAAVPVPDETNSTSIHHSHQSGNSTENSSSPLIMNDHPSPKSALSASDRLAINDAIQTLRENSRLPGRMRTTHPAQRCNSAPPAATLSTRL